MGRGNLDFCAKYPSKVIFVQESLVFRVRLGLTGCSRFKKSKWVIRSYLARFPANGEASGRPGIDLYELREIKPVTRSAVLRC